MWGYEVPTRMHKTYSGGWDVAGMLSVATAIRYGSEAERAVEAAMHEAVRV